jgi:gluconokinase
MTFIIGIDIGTTNTKAVAFTNQGLVLASAGASYTVLPGPPGQHELDPDELFEAVLSVLKEVLKVSGYTRESAVAEGLAGISFSCAMHSLIAVDQAGCLLTHAITWADLRSVTYANSLKGSPAGKRIYRQTGTPIHPMSPLCKLLWLKDKEPSIFGRAAKFISIKEYIWWRLFGKYQVDHSIASATGLFDIYSFDWYSESLALAGIGIDHLSEPVSCTHMESALLAEYAGSLGMPPNLPWIIGGSDGCLANLGSLAVNQGETALTIGTSGAVRMTTGAPRHDVQERIFNYILTRDLYVSGGAVNNGGGVVQWFNGQFPQREPSEKLIQAMGVPAGRSSAGGPGDFTGEADSVAPGSEGLVFLPYLQGERAPIWDANAKGIFFGIRSGHEHRHFMRAVMEGISFSLHGVGLSLEETIGPVKHIYASGGFIRSKTWLQMIADVFNRRVYVTNVADASAIGAVIMGFYALGLIASPKDAAGLIRIQETYEPDMLRHQVYMKNEAVFSQLYIRLKDLM